MRDAQSHQRQTLYVVLTGPWSKLVKCLPVQLCGTRGGMENREEALCLHDCGSRQLVQPTLPSLPAPSSCF